MLSLVEQTEKEEKDFAVSAIGQMDRRNQIFMLLFFKFDLTNHFLVFRHLKGTLLINICHCLPRKSRVEHICISVLQDQ